MHNAAWDEEAGLSLLPVKPLTFLPLLCASTQFPRAPPTATNREVVVPVMGSSQEQRPSIGLSHSLFLLCQYLKARPDPFVGLVR